MNVTPRRRELCDTRRIVFLRECCRCQSWPDHRPQTRPAERRRDALTKSAFGCTIAIHLGADGSVGPAKVVSAEGGTPERWQRAADAARTELLDKKVTLPSEFTRGAIVYVDVVVTAGPSNEGADATKKAPKNTVRTSTRIVTQ